MRAPKPQQGGYTRKAAKELLNAAQAFSQPKQEWRSNRITATLLTNPVLMRELYKMANHEPYQVRLLINDCSQHVGQAASWLHQQSPQQLQQMQNLPPNHPSIINNINHPLNPSNPNNLMLNPALNLLFQQDEAVQAGILDEEIEQTAENDSASALMRDEDFQTAAQQGLTDYPAISPHKELSLPPHASEEETETACLSQLAETAPAPGEEPSEHYTKTAAAAMTLGFGYEELKSEKGLDLHDAAHLAATAAPAA